MIALICFPSLLAAWPVSAPAAGNTPTPVGPSALVLVLPASRAPASELTTIPGLSVGLMSATQGAYSEAQMLLDMTQGARVAYSDYSPSKPPSLSLNSTRISSWPQVLARARSAPQTLVPGLLAARIPGGAGYAGVTGSGGQGGVVAADRTGHLADASIGSASTLIERIARLHAHRKLVVAELPAGTPGVKDLRELSAERDRSELEIVIGRPPDEPGNELVWVGLAGLGGGETLSSQTTRERGLVAAIDLAPTILDHLGLSVPSAMSGTPLELDGRLELSSLRSLKARLQDIDPRRLPALGALLCMWALLLLCSLLVKPAAGNATRARALRLGALALLWTPVAVLITAALEPPAALEYAILVLACFSLGALSDALLGWPRAPIAPAALALLTLTADALFHTQLLMRSLLGPNPAYGARFYGIGNELKPGLAVLVLGAVAAYLYPAVRGRRAATAMALSGVLLAGIEGWAKIGAGVGSVILVSAGFALATIMLLPGALTRRRALIALCCPLLALLVLAALDLVTAHGNSHFAGSLFEIRSAGDLREVIVRRYSAAWRELKNGAMPLATMLALAAAAFGVVRRRSLLRPVAGDPAWSAALFGGLTAGILGALVEDSGPVLLVVAVFTLGCVLSYLWGKPASRIQQPEAQAVAQSEQAP